MDFVKRFVAIERGWDRLCPVCGYEAKEDYDYSPDDDSYKEKRAILLKNCILLSRQKIKSAYRKKMGTFIYDKHQKLDMII